MPQQESEALNQEKATCQDAIQNLEGVNLVLKTDCKNKLKQCHFDSNDLLLVNKTSMLLIKTHKCMVRKKN